MVGNSSIRISWGRSSANRNVVGMGMGMTTGPFPQSAAYSRFGDVGALAAAYGGFGGQPSTVMDPCVLLQPCLRVVSATRVALHVSDLINVFVTSNVKAF